MVSQVFLNATAPLMVRDRRPCETDASRSNKELFLKCHANGFSFLNKWFNHSMKHSIKWHSPDSVTTLLFTPTSQSHGLQLLLRIWTQIPITKMTTQTIKIARFPPHEPQTTKFLRNECVSFEFSQKLEFRSMPINTFWKISKNSIISSGNLNTNYPMYDEFELPLSIVKESLWIMLRRY